MQRLTAIFLLLLALTGLFVPVTLAVTAAPPHACCIHHAHHCHDSAVSSSELTIRSTGCCNHDCCRGATTLQKAHPGPGLSVTFARQIDGFISAPVSVTPTQQLPTLQSPRAPPHIFLG